MRGFRAMHEVLVRPVTPRCAPCPYPQAAVRVEYAATKSGCEMGMSLLHIKSESPRQALHSAAPRTWVISPSECGRRPIREGVSGFLRSRKTRDTSPNLFAFSHLPSLTRNASPPAPKVGVVQLPLMEVVGRCS
jgi:hypothetical protein